MFLADMVNGTPRVVTAHVCDVNKAVQSISRMVVICNKAVFGGEGGSYVEDKETGEGVDRSERRDV